MNIALEMEVKASHKIIKKLKRDNELLGEYEEASIDKDDLIRGFEKRKTVADKVIQNLKEELLGKGKEICNAKKMSEDYEKLKAEKDALEKDISEICMENDLRERGIHAIKKEMKRKIDVVLDEKTVQTDIVKTEEM